MISFDFEYYKPTTIEEALQLFNILDQQGKQPIYFSGGTEIITYGRVNKIVTGAIIDIKGVPDCLVLKKENNKLTLGSAQSLTKIRDMKLFPLLNKTIVEIADHTARNKITLGGNICANIMYRETVLPFLLTESEVVIAGASGIRQVPIMDVFNQKLLLERGEFLVQVVTSLHDIELPFISVKKRRQWDVGYPLITIAALKKNNQIRVAFSGLCSFPFRSLEIEDSLNNQALSRNSRVDEVLKLIPSPILDDVNGSLEYRKFVLQNTLQDVLDTLEGEGNGES